MEDMLNLVYTSGYLKFGTKIGLNQAIRDLYICHMFPSLIKLFY